MTNTIPGISTSPAGDHVRIYFVLFVAAVLVGGGLYIFNRTTSNAGTEGRRPLLNATSAPIVAQSSALRFGSGQDAYIGFEGKIYNPNSYPVKNVRVQWRVYKTPPPRDAELWKRFGFQESCEVDFAFIPGRTTYDFRSGRIKYRDKDSVAGLGLTEAPMTDLKPEVTFSVER